MRQLANKGPDNRASRSGRPIRLLSVITNPNVAFILLMVGIYGLIFELSTPGAIAPGVIGTICLLLGLYALNMLPINYTGLALLLLGIAFLVVEIFNPTVVLGLGGVAAFLLGAAMLFKIEGPGYRLSWTVVIIAMAMIVSLTVVVLARSGARAETRHGLGCRPCAVCLPKFSTGPAAKVTSSRMVSAGRPTGRKPLHPERWSKWLVSRT